MPATREAADATARYRTDLIAARRRTVAAVAAWWFLDRSDLDNSFLRWLGAATALVTAGQGYTARRSMAYLAEFVGAELGAPQDLVEIPPVVGVSLDGRPLSEALLPSLYTVKRRIGAGDNFDEASAAGRARAMRTSTVELDGAGDRALSRGIADSGQVRGWRRVVSGAACGACLASATGEVRDPREHLLRHPHCRCTKEPVVAGVTERHRRATGRELFDRKSPSAQAATFAGRGGALKAALVRDGAIDFADLAATRRQALAGRPDVLDETPLVALLAKDHPR